LKEAIEQVRFMLARANDAPRQCPCTASPTFDERERIKGVCQVANLDVRRSWVEAGV
jgi:hypothetical protein